MLIGPVLTLPLGFALLTIIVVAIEMAIGEISWRFMDHLPEDDQDWDTGNRFVINDEQKI